MRKRKQGMSRLQGGVFSGSIGRTERTSKLDQGNKNKRRAAELSWEKKRTKVVWVVETRDGRGG